jgi:hypothetical protein
MNPADDLAKWAADNGFGIYDPDGTTSTIFTGDMPETPPDAIVLRDTAGYPSDYAMSGATEAGPVVERAGCQVSIRRTTYTAARDAAWALYVKLCKFAGVTINGRYYHIAMPQQNPFPMPRGRTATPGWTTFVFNLAVERRFPE